ncbi:MULTISPECIES: phage tail tube protein [unclassified Dehalobacter]|uniref:phage tail tube protein n=1 Tax=unclassified Dehalobacter TaxID=2635733 RepID=UPI000E6B8A6A|nr:MULTISPECIES: phage tail tube protein [unclassified Dehalobacter]RJE48691.1 phage portal protein [Dehalobacter sp. MCB1]TCX53394.1 phage portal protein [Dehalobacter sp. 14DCB1]TCX54409.1 phage portal protein [Dehalobacter sp. 12DCB1]
MALSPDRIMNGTHGEIWLDDEKVAECSGLQAKINLMKSDVQICGRMAKGYKVTGWEGKGSLKLHKVSSRMINKIAQDIKNGKGTTCTIVSKLADPDAYGSERIVLKNVMFDEVSLADWEAGKNGEETIPFTFSDFDLLDVIDPALVQA